MSNNQISNNHCNLTEPDVSDRSETFIGIDVSKDELAVFISSTKEMLTFANQMAEFPKIIRLCHKHSAGRICLEATGGYQTPLLLALAEKDLPVCLVNPRQVRHFARGFGQLAKTDAIDAQVLALFAEQVKPRITVVPGEDEQMLSALIRRREQLIEMLTAEKNRFDLAHHSIKSNIRASINWLTDQLETLDDDIDTTFKDSAVWHKAQLLETIPGLARVWSIALLAELPELGTLSNKQIAALVGVAPFTQTSGKWRGRERTQQGRKFVRQKLYMTAFNAIRYNQIIKTFYERLRANGKPFKVAIVAVMRKLLCICNSMLRHNQTWQPNLT